MTKHEQMIEDASALTLSGEHARKVDYATEQYLTGRRSDEDIRTLAESISYVLRGI